MISLVHDSGNIFSAIPHESHVQTSDTDPRIATTWSKGVWVDEGRQHEQGYWRSRQSNDFQIQARERPAEKPDHEWVRLPHGRIPGTRQQLPLHGPTNNQRLAAPIRFIESLLNCWKLDKKDAVHLLGFEETEAGIVSGILAGSEQLRGRDAKERLFHLLSIRESLHYFFQNLETENDWLREPQPLLDEQTPMNLLLEGSMGNILLVREYVDSMAGR